MNLVYTTVHIFCDTFEAVVPPSRLFHCRKRANNDVGTSPIIVLFFFQSEEVYWMERQLRICHEKCVQECKFSSQFLDDLIRQGHSLDANSESELMNVLQKRCQLLLLLHHEYRQLCEDKTLKGILQIVEKNIQIAVAFFLAYIDTKDVELQTELLEGTNSQQIYSSTKYQVRFCFLLIVF